MKFWFEIRFSVAIPYTGQIIGYLSRNNPRSRFTTQHRPTIINQVSSVGTYRFHATSPYSFPFLSFHAVRHPLILIFGVQSGVGTLPLFQCEVFHASPPNSDIGSGFFQYSFCSSLVGSFSSISTSSQFQLFSMWL